MESTEPKIAPIKSASYCSDCCSQLCCLLVSNLQSNAINFEHGEYLHRKQRQLTSIDLSCQPDDSYTQH